MTRKTKIPKPESALEAELALQIRTMKLPAPQREYLFHSTRKWRFDFAWPKIKFAVEVEGGTWSQGKHSRGLGFREDCIKYGEAMLLGWSVYRVTGDLVKDGGAIKVVEVMLEDFFKSPADNAQHE